MRCLIVDDDPCARKLIEIFLGKFQVETKGAANGQDALEIVATAEEAFDFITLDINMPIMSGIEFLEQLNEKGLIKTNAVLVVTTELNNEKIKKVISMGASYIVNKPFDKETLIEGINRVLKQKNKSELEQKDKVAV